MMPYRIIIRKNRSPEKYGKPILVIETGKEPGMEPDNLPGNVITDDRGSVGLLSFVKDAVNGVKKNVSTYWTDGYEIKSVIDKEVPVLEINFRLADDYEPSLIEPNFFLEILEKYIKEHQQFEMDPTEYMDKNLDKIVIQ